MAKLTPYMKSANAREQAEFYIAALGGEIRSLKTWGEVPGTPPELADRVVHLDLQVAGTTLFLTDADNGPVSYGQGINLSLELATQAEARAAFERLAEGGKVVYPLHDAFWGSLFGQLEDRFGVQWMITNEADASHTA